MYRASVTQPSSTKVTSIMGTGTRFRVCLRCRLFYETMRRSPYIWRHCFTKLPYRAHDTKSTMASWTYVTFFNRFCFSLGTVKLFTHAGAVWLTCLRLNLYGCPGESSSAKKHISVSKINSGALPQASPPACTQARLINLVMFICTTCVPKSVVRGTASSA